MKRIELVFAASAVAICLTLAGVGSAKPQPRAYPGGPLTRILGAIEVLGARVDLGFRKLLDGVGDLGLGQRALFGGQEKIAAGQVAIQEEVRRLADLVGESGLGAPDLLLVPADGHLCRFVEPEGGLERLRVRILNAGTAGAGESSLVVDDTVLGAINVTVPPLAARAHHDAILAAPPFTCPIDVDADCVVDLEVDAFEEVSESNESNNLYLGVRCARG